jgi:hypothetical protein
MFIYPFVFALRRMTAEELDKLLAHKDKPKDKAPEPAGIELSQSSSAAQSSAAAASSSQPSQALPPP